MRQFLRRYLESWGNELPDDYRNFATDGQFHNECVFCGEEHHNIKVLRYDGKKDQKIFSDTYCCEQCNDQIAKSQFGQMFDYEPVRSAYLKKRRTEDIRIMDLQFDHKVYLYYRHLNPNHDLYVKNRENSRCYICDDLIEKQVQSIPVPVTGGNKVTGGRVHICPKCEGDVKDIDDIYNKKVINKELERVKCPSCKLHYYIDNEEATYRAETNTSARFEKEWMCPECSHKSITGADENSWLHNPENDAPRFDMMERFMPATCTCCGSYFYIDLTMYTNHLYINHYIRDGEIICQKCTDVDLETLLLGEGTYRFSHKIVIKVAKSSEENVWKFDSYRLGKNPGELPQHIISSHISANNGVECVSIVFNEVRMLLYGEQAELWE